MYFVILFSFACGYTVYEITTYQTRQNKYIKNKKIQKDEWKFVEVVEADRNLGNIRPWYCKKFAVVGCNGLIAAFGEELDYQFGFVSVKPESFEEVNENTFDVNYGANNGFEFQAYGSIYPYSTKEEVAQEFKILVDEGGVFKEMINYLCFNGVSISNQIELRNLYGSHHADQLTRPFKKRLSLVLAFKHSYIDKVKLYLSQSNINQ